MRQLTLKLKTLLRRLRRPRPPQWTIEDDPESVYALAVLRDPYDNEHGITVSVAGFQSDGRPYFLIAECRVGLPMPIRTSLKGKLEQAKRMGEDWASEW